jgi:endonuclease III
VTSGIFDRLAAAYGPQEPCWPTDPYLFLIWRHCGYPASDAACAKGWSALTRDFRLDPESLFAAEPASLTEALRAGGMVPEIRARRLREIAERVLKEFGGDLGQALRSMPISRARVALKKFPTIADPGADLIILFAGLAPVAAVPSNCPHVLVRIQRGLERENYGVTYREAQEGIESGTPATLDARSQSYLLLKRHGQDVCKRTNPKCDACPVSDSCAYFAGKNRGRTFPENRGIKQRVS